MMGEPYKYLFGPVPSRRLGRSLGIDVTPGNVCSFDCLFCQCGCTLKLVTERGEWVPFTEVCAELERWLAEDGGADVITFAGSGEPTLYSRLGELIAFIKERSSIPVVLLSNGTLMDRADVRSEAAKADIVKVSLSAWDEASFQKVNRPASDLTFARLLAGEQAFREEFFGELWMEVFLLEGINSEPDQVRQIATAVKRIRPDRIHLNTSVRPPADSVAQPVSKERLAAFCELFVPPAEVIASFPPAAPKSVQINTETLVDLIHRHPATSSQLAAVAGSSIAEIEVALAPLVTAGKLRTEEHGGEVYYK
ncbi:MAG: radical SAM protein [Kiritimatiellales bacterium]